MGVGVCVCVTLCVCLRKRERERERERESLLKFVCTAEALEIKGTARPVCTLRQLISMHAWS